MKICKTLCFIFTFIICQNAFGQSAPAVQEYPEILLEFSDNTTVYASGESIMIECKIKNNAENDVMVDKWYAFPNAQIFYLYDSNSLRLMSLQMPPAMRSDLIAIKKNSSIEFDFDLLEIYPPSINFFLCKKSVTVPGRYAIFMVIDNICNVNMLDGLKRDVGPIESNRLDFTIVSPDEKTISEWLASFKKFDSKEQCRILTVLGGLRQYGSNSSEIYNMICNILKSSAKPEVKVAAMHALYCIESNNIPIDMFEDLVLNDGNEKVTNTAAAILGLIKSHHSIPVLIESLNRDNGAAIRALGDIGDLSAIPALEALAIQKSGEWKKGIQVNIDRIKIANGLPIQESNGFNTVEKSIEILQEKYLPLWSLIGAIILLLAGIFMAITKKKYLPFIIGAILAAILCAVGYAVSTDNHSVAKEESEPQSNHFEPDKHPDTAEPDHAVIDKNVPVKASPEKPFGVKPPDQKDNVPETTIPVPTINDKPKSKLSDMGNEIALIIPEGDTAKLIEFIAGSPLDKSARGAAQALGDLVVAKKPEDAVTPDELKQIHEAIQKWLDICAATNEGATDEYVACKRQIERLWKFCVPQLLDSIGSDKRTLNEDAIKSLVLMRDEEIIKAVVDKYKTTPSLQVKKDCLWAMEMMLDDRHTIVNNREQLDAKTIAESVKQYILPCLESAIRTEQDAQILKEVEAVLAKLKSKIEEIR